ncbi:MAG TPA: hypothetical protein PLF81_18065 [Candidatus Anammoximicrobium sp.]|nr:hypothetical protein [Candidatus Anammoximicrobium sp.]
MFNRKYMLPLVVAAAAGGPYLLTQDNWSQSAFQALDRAVTSDDASSVATPTPVPAVSGGVPLPDFRSEFSFGRDAQYPRTNVAADLVGPPVAQLGELLRFDVTPQWVTARWPRVTATLAEIGLEGMRVPVVTGTNVDDLAGSLTYYFNRYQQLQRLSFEGYTGDERKLVATVTQYYGLQPEPTLDAGMYVARWNGQPSSLLRVVRAPIMTHDSPHSQLHVLLELNRPGMEFGLSPQAVAILDRDRNSRRW